MENFKMYAFNCVVFMNLKLEIILRISSFKLKYDKRQKLTELHLKLGILFRNM